MLTNIMRPIRVLLVENHPEVSKRVAARLAFEADIEVAGRVGVGDGVVELAGKIDPDVILIDPITDDELGMGTLQEIRSSFPNVQIVVLTAVVDTALKLEFKKMGIENILEKGIDSDTLLNILRNLSKTL